METNEVLSKILTEIRGHKPLLSVREAAAYFDVSERSMRRFIKLPEITTIKLPGIGLRISKSSLDGYMEKRIKNEKENQEKEDAIKFIVDKALSRN